MNELNNNYGLWMALAAVVLSIVALVSFGWKIFRGIEGLEKEFEEKPKSENLKNP